MSNVPTTLGELIQEMKNPKTETILKDVPSDILCLAITDETRRQLMKTALSLLEAWDAKRQLTGKDRPEQEELDRLKREVDAVQICSGMIIRYKEEMQRAEEAMRRTLQKPWRKQIDE